MSWFYESHVPYLLEPVHVSSGVRRKYSSVLYIYVWGCVPKCSTSLVMATLSCQPFHSGAFWSPLSHGLWAELPTNLWANPPTAMRDGLFKEKLGCGGYCGWGWGESCYSYCPPTKICVTHTVNRAKVRSREKCGRLFTNCWPHRPLSIFCPK